MFFLAGFAHGGSATWDLTPTSSDWNTATNWTPPTVPNGSGDTATFALSNTTAISISTAQTTVDGITFAPGAGSFTITATPNNFFSTLILDGAGITNNSGITQNFVNAAPIINKDFKVAGIFFENSAMAGSQTVFTNAGGIIAFFNTSTAANARIINNGSSNVVGQTAFRDNSTAGNATIINSVNAGAFGFTGFIENTTAGNATITNDGGIHSGQRAGETRFDGIGGTPTAGNATITNYGGTVSGALGGTTIFLRTSTAGNATITNDGGIVSGAAGGTTTFDFSEGTPTAGNATIINNGGMVSGAGGGTTRFLGTSTARSATLIANGGTSGGQGGAIFFEGFSTGGTSRVEVFGNGNLDISFHNAPSQKFPGVAIGSIEGDGNVFLGANNLTLGGTNTSNAFSGAIQDGGLGGGTGGSLTKIGTGTLDLTASNTYTGNTDVKKGVLKIDGSITSNTFVNHGGTLAGIGTINGTVTANHATVSPGDTTGTLTVNNYAQPIIGSGKLLIDIAGTTPGQFGVLNVLGDANVNSFLDPVLLNGFIPSIGDEFTFLNYESLSGAFSIQNGGIFDNGMERWVVTYHANDAVLTATKNVPDKGSTFLLLTLSLLGLMAFRGSSCAVLGGKTCHRGANNHSFPPALLLAAWDPRELWLRKQHRRGSEKERENFNHALFAFAFFSRRRDRELLGAISRGLLDCPRRV